MKTERTKNSTYNIIFSGLQLFLTTVLSFTTRTIFINTLGKEFLGLDGLMLNIISMLSLAELGISSAINFSLYKPIAHNDNKAISALMTLYKKVYKYIGIFILIIGLCLAPFIKYFINGYEFNNLILIYLLYLINVVVSYFFSYRETLIIAYQKGYKIVKFKISCILLTYISQIIVLIYTKNIILYLTMNVIFSILQNVLISFYVKREYSEVNYNSKEKIDENTKKDIIKNIKGMLVNRIGDYLLHGTDNIIISSIDIALTGLYSNYLSIISIMKTFMNVVYNGIVASFGNVVATENIDMQENVFNISNFLGFVISGFIATECLALFNDFIIFWIGKDYLFDFWIVAIICFNFYFYSQQLSLETVKKATGLYYIDAKYSIIQAIINIVTSIILGRFIGITGVLIGTLISYVLVSCIFRPHIIYKQIFNKSAKKYYLVQIKYICTIIMIMLLTITIDNYLNLPPNLINILFKGIINSILFTLFIVIFYFKNDNFKHLYNMFFRKKAKKI